METESNQDHSEDPLHNPLPINPKPNQTSVTESPESTVSFDSSSDPNPKKTRELPNLSDCHSCGVRINHTNPRDRLQPLDSMWRIVLLCKKCTKRRSADWKAARAHMENGIVYQGRVEGCNGGGLLIRFYSLVGFLPYPQLSPSHSCKEPDKTIQEIAKALTGSLISVKLIHAEKEKRKLIFSEKEAVWSKYSNSVKIGNVYKAKVGSVEDYGAFAHLQHSDGLYHPTGLVHVSEVSWDLVQDVRDILNEGDDVKVKVIGVDRNKSRITLSIKQLEEDPLLETLEKVIPQDGSAGSTSDSTADYVIEPLPGLETIVEELQREDGFRKYNS